MLARPGELGQFGTRDFRRACARGVEGLPSSLMDRNRELPSRPAPDTVEEALALSLQHARNSASEALMAARMLMDALSILLANEPVVRHAQADSPIAKMAEAIERWAGSLRGPEPASPSSDLPAVLEALEIEIGRWEIRARQDANARTVLHAFLGMREIMWEFNPPAGRNTLRSRPRKGSQSAGIRGPALSTPNP